MLAIYRTIFTFFLCITLWVFVTQFQSLQIDTSLTDLAPQFAQNPETKAAVNAVSKSLESRIVFLIESQASENSNDVSAQQIQANLQSAKSNINETIYSLSLVEAQMDEDESLKTIVDFFLPHRFQLLNKEQSQLLSNVENAKLLDEIADQSLKELYILNTAPKLIPFETDPLGWHNNTIVSYFKDFFENPNSNKQHEFIVFKLSNNSLSLTQQQELNTQLDQIIESTQEQFSVDISRSGVFFFATEAASQSKQDISLISSVSMIAVLIVLISTFRNIGPVILPFISIALGVSFAVALTHWIFGSIHILTIVFGASLIGVVIDYSLHFFYHKSHHKIHSQSLINALLLSLATSLIGYASLSLSDLTALKKVALFSCCGLIMAWLTVISLGEYFTQRMQAPRESILAAIVNIIRLPIQQFSGKYVFTGLIIIIISSIGIFAISPPVSDDPRLFFNPSQALLEEESRVGKLSNDFEPGRYLLIKSNQQASLHDITSDFDSTVEASEILNSSHFLSLINWIPSPNEQQENYALQSKLYAENGAIDSLYKKLQISNTEQDNQEKLLAIYSAAKTQQLNIETASSVFEKILPPLWLSYEQQELAFVLIRKGSDMAEIESIANQIEGLEYINTLAATTEVLSQQRHSASLLLLLAYALISIMLVFRFKSISALWMVSIPLASSCCLVILFFITGNTLNLFHFMALFLVLGLGMDYSIFVKEMRQSLSITHHSIFLSATTSLLSFGLLAISSIPVVSAFGMTLLIGNLCNLIGSFIYSEQLTRNE